MHSLENDLKKEPEFFIDYSKWRRLIYKANLLCMLAVLITEIGMFFVFKAGNLFLQPIPVYLFRFLALPTIINASLLLIGRVCQHVFQKSERALNVIPVMQLTMLCFMVSCVHHVFAVTFCTFSFPLFLSAIFSNKRLTSSVTIISLIFLTIAQFIGPGFNDVYSEYLIPEYFVAVTALLASYLICTILVRFQKEKNSIIEKSYQSRMEVINQLNIDQKTGLYGVTAFNNRLSQLLTENQNDQVIAIAIFDIDDFKKVNDSFGHAKGDDVILCLAQLIKDICGEKFFPVRFGGEEFIILFHGGDLSEYRKLTKRLLVEFAASEYDFTDVSITISAGISQWENGISGDDLFAQADDALYFSKASGKNRLTVYNNDVKKYRRSPNSNSISPNSVNV